MNDVRLAEAVFKVEGMSSDIAEIKVSMKELAVAVGRMAVIEERQSQARVDIQRAFIEIGGHDVRLKTLETVQPIQSLTTIWVQRAVWAIVAAVIASVLALVLNSRAIESRKNDIPQLTMPGVAK